MQSLAVSSASNEITLFKHLRVYLNISIVFIASLFFSQTLWAIPLLGAADTNTPVVQEAPKDPLGRETPRGTVLGYIDAMAKEDLEKATQFFDLSFLSKKNKTKKAQLLAQNLRTLLDKNGSVVAGALLSDKPMGQESDGLDHNLDKVGTFKLEDESISVLVNRITDKDNNSLWFFSAQTLEQIPDDISELTSDTLIHKVLPESLNEHKWGGVPVAQWIIMFFLMIASYSVARIFTLLITRSIRLIFKKKINKRHTKLIGAFSVPVYLYLAVWILLFSSKYIGISIIIRQYFSEATIILALVAVLILFWRLIDVSAQISEKRAVKRKNFGAQSAILFFQRTAKFALAAIGTVIILNTIGFDITTGLAAFGIGGLALALGAQRTIENLVGSLNIIFDQPVRVGDFCRVGEIKGTVESIGMRSTRLRTLDRTVVTIPNCNLSGQQIENYTHRDNFLYNPTIKLRFETSVDQMRYLLVAIREILYSHPRIDPDPARVRFIEFGDSSLDIEILAYIKAVDYHESLEIQEDLNLNIAAVIEDSGTSLAFPSQTLYLAHDKGLSEEKTQMAENKVKRWKKHGDLQIPRFSAERQAELKNSLAYPPKGSSAANPKYYPEF